MKGVCVCVHSSMGTTRGLTRPDGSRQCRVMGMTAGNKWILEGSQ